MNQRCFSFLRRALHFDDVDDLQERMALYKLAKICPVFEPFVEQYKNAYNPSEYLTLYEMLDAFTSLLLF